MKLCRNCGGPLDGNNARRYCAKTECQKARDHKNVKKYREKKKAAQK